MIWSNFLPTVNSLLHCACPFYPAGQLEDPEDGDAVFYIMLRGVDRFYSEYSRFPGAENRTAETDVPQLKVYIALLRRLPLYPFIVFGDIKFKLTRKCMISALNILEVAILEL